MTANELKYEFLQGYDKMFEYGAPAYDDKQISNFLTRAQLRVFKRYYSPFKNKFREGFESSEFKSKGLAQLIRSASLGAGITESSSQTGVHPQGTFYDLPSDYQFTVEEAVELDGDEVGVKAITHDFYTKNVDNPYKKPYSDLVWRMDFSREDHGEDSVDFTGRTAKRVELIVENKSTNPVTGYRLRYLCTPPDIVCDELITINQRHCILDEVLQDEIVDEAVKMATAATKPEEYQISYTEQRENES